MARVKRNFTYPGLTTDVMARIKACHVCLAKITKEKIKAGIHVPQQNGYPLQSVYVDLVGPFKPTKAGHEYILSIEDGFSRFIMLQPLKSKRSAEVVRTLIDKYISVFGCPVRIHSDQGKEFTSALMEGVCKEMGVKKTLTPSYNPSSNMVERFHRTLSSMLRTILGREDTNWDSLLPAITLAYNSKLNESTGVTPALAFLGKEMKIPVDLIIQLPDQEPRNSNTYIRDLIGRYNKVYQYMTTKQEGIFRRNAKQYVGEKDMFQEGDMVWYLTPRQVAGKPKKITNNWTGPWTVTRKAADVLYDLRGTREDGTTVDREAVNISRLRKYNGPPGKKLSLPKQVQFAEEDEDAEEVQASKIFVPVSTNIPVYSPSFVPDIRDIGRREDSTSQSTEQSFRTPEPRPEPSRRKRSLRSDTDGDTDQETRKRRPDRADPAVKRGYVETSEEETETTKKFIPEKGIIRKRPTTDTETDLEPEEERSKTTRPRKKIGQQVTDYQHAADTPEAETSTDQDMSEGTLASMLIPVKRNSKLPVRATDGAAGYDIHAAEKVVLNPKSVTAIPTGLAMSLPDGVYAQIQPRSGLARKKGLFAIAGVIDTDFVGEIQVLMYNSSQEEVVIQEGERISQILFLNYNIVEFQQTDHLPETKRGTSGF